MICCPEAFGWFLLRGYTLLSQNNIHSKLKLVYNGLRMPSDHFIGCRRFTLSCHIAEKFLTEIQLCIDTCTMPSIMAVNPAMFFQGFTEPILLVNIWQISHDQYTALPKHAQTSPDHFLRINVARKKMRCARKQNNIKLSINLLCQFMCESTQKGHVI
ncbi:hypothetical protein D1872_215430 [compost metagenome]